MCTVRSSGPEKGACIPAWTVGGGVSQHALGMGYVSQHVLDRGCVSQQALTRGSVYPSMHWAGGCVCWGVSAQGGVCQGGVCQMVSAWGCLPQCMLGYTPLPVNRMTDRQVYKHYLSATSFADGKYFCMLVNIFGEIFQRLFVSLNPRVIVSNFETNFFTDLC